MAEQLALEQVAAGSAAQLSVTNGPSARRLGVWIGARDELLARAGLALE